MLPNVRFVLVGSGASPFSESSSDDGAFRPSSSPASRVVSLYAPTLDVAKRIRNLCSHWQIPLIENHTSEPRQLSPVFELVNNGLIEGFINSSEDFVLTYDKELVHEAQQYATETGRKLLSVVDIEQATAILKIISAGSCIIIHPPEVSLGDLLTLENSWMEKERDRVLGHIIGTNEAERAFLTAKSLIALFSSVLSERGSSVFLPISDYMWSSTRGGGRPSALEAKEISTYLSRQVSLLVASAHSNGTDSDFGKAVICGREKSNPNSIFPERRLPCFSSGQCNRLAPGKELYPADVMGAATVLLYACSSVLLGKGIYDSESTILYRLIKAQSAFTIICSWGIHEEDSALCVEASTIFRDEGELSVATYRLNSMHFERFQDTRSVLLLFGDPRTTLNWKGPSDRENGEMVEALKESLHLYGDSSHADLSRAIHLQTSLMLSRLSLLQAALIAMRVRVQEKGKTPRLDEISIKIEKTQSHYAALTDLLTCVRSQTGRVSSRNLSVVQVVSQLGELLQELHESFAVTYYRYVNRLEGTLWIVLDWATLLCDSGDQNKKTETCPYCGMDLVEQSIYSRPEFSGILRTRLLCHNCGCISDGSTELLGSVLRGENTFAPGESIKIEIQLHTSLLGTTRTSFCGVLQPFLRETGIDDIPGMYESKLIDFAGNICLLQTEGIKVPQNYVGGTYLLSVLLFVNECFVVLQRPLYIRPVQ